MKPEIIFILAAVLVSTLAAYTIIKNGKWLFGELFDEYNNRLWFKPPMIIQQQWRAVDYRTDISIFDITGNEDQFFKTYYVEAKKDEVIIHDNAQLDYVIQKHAHALTKQIIKDGCIKIINEPDHFSGHPFRRLVTLHLKIYKPE